MAEVTCDPTRLHELVTQRIADVLAEVETDLQHAYGDLYRRETAARRALRASDTESLVQAAERVVKQTQSAADLTAILRAIWPAWLAACEMCNDRYHIGGRGELEMSIHEARTALTPDLLAVIKAAGLEHSR